LVRKTEAEKKENEEREKVREQVKQMIVSVELTEEEIAAYEAKVREDAEKATKTETTPDTPATPEGGEDSTQGTPTNEDHDHVVDDDAEDAEEKALEEAGDKVIEANRVTPQEKKIGRRKKKKKKTN